MEPIHRAALDGDVAAIDRLVAEDGRRFDAQIQGGQTVGFGRVMGCPPLMLAAYKGHDTAVARLLALAADLVSRNIDVLRSALNWTVLGGDHHSMLGLLLSAGARINARTIYGETPLILAAIWDRSHCAILLINRGGDDLELNDQDNAGCTALYHAAYRGNMDIVQALLQAGANPTIRNNNGETPLDIARRKNHTATIPLLQAAVAEPQRSRALFKVRALLDSAHATRKARTDARDKGQPAAGGPGGGPSVPQAARGAGPRPAARRCG